MFVENLSQKNITKLLSVLKETKTLDFKGCEYFATVRSSRGNFLYYIKLDNQSIYLNDEHIYVIKSETYDHYKDVLTDEEKQAYYDGMFKDRELYEKVDIAYTAFMYSTFGQKYFDVMDNIIKMNFGTWVSNLNLHSAAKKFYEENIDLFNPEEKER